MNVAIIPARGGSKRIPKKNIKFFCGKPIILYSIQKAIESKLFDYVFVSTDDKEISDISIQNGASVPFLRDKEFSDDFTGTDEVIKNTLLRLEEEGYEIDLACCIYPTAPLMQIKDIKDGYDKIKLQKWETVFSATTFSSPIQRSFKMNSEGGLEMFYPENFNKRSQDLDTALHDAGQFYWSSKKSWIEKKPGFSKNSSVITIPNWRVQDIDNLDDWYRAELIYRVLEAQ